MTGNYNDDNHWDGNDDDDTAVSCIGGIRFCSPTGTKLKLSYQNPAIYWVVAAIAL